MDRRRRGAALDPLGGRAFLGSPPVVRQSGHWAGHAFIRCGCANVLQALYMPVLVAARFNPDLAAKYRQLIAASKPVKVALVALMRKLIILANALLEANRQWVLKTP